MWGLWSDLDLPTILIEFDEQRLNEITHALEAHQLELERNDYRRLVRGRAEMNAVRGPELIFGFGSRGDSGPYAELLTEAIARDGHWLLGARRRLDLATALHQAPSDVTIGDWLYR